MDTTTSGIYIILNLIDGKVYIGQAKNLLKRKQSHLRYLRNNTHCQHGKCHLQLAFNKYGEDSFLFMTLAEAPIEELNNLESSVIQATGSTNKNNGYNICPYGNVPRGVKQSKETIALRVKKLIGQKRTEQHKMNIKKGKGPISEETRRRLSEAHKNNKYALGTRKSFCKNGHARTDENVLKNNRACRECVNTKRRKVNGYIAKKYQSSYVRKKIPKQTKVKTHCKNGHEFTFENTYIKPNRKYKECRICIANTSNKYRLKKVETVI